MKKHDMEHVWDFVQFNKPGLCQKYPSLGHGSDVCYEASLLPPSLHSHRLLLAIAGVTGRFHVLAQAGNPLYVYRSG